MPVKKSLITIKELRGGKFQVSRDGISAYATTRKNAEAQARFLLGLSHGMEPRKRNPCERIRRIRKKTNPPESRAFYDRVLTVDAQKAPGHPDCDEECRQSGHKYSHDFTGHHKIYRNPDGSLTIR